MIEKMNLHYSFTNPASVYDEEALTALELAGRQGAKINEVITDQNNLRTETENRLSAQDADIKNQKENVIPSTISNEVLNHINNGTFDTAINEYAGNLENRLDNLLGSVTQGSTSMDAEIIDARTGVDGMQFSNLGAAIRKQVDSLIRPMYLSYHTYAMVAPESITVVNGCVASVHFTPTAASSLLAWKNPFEPNRNFTLILETSENITEVRPYLNNVPEWNNADGVKMDVTRNARLGDTTYIDLRYSQGETSPKYLIIKFKGVANENSWVKLSAIPNLINITDKPDVKLIDSGVAIHYFSVQWPDKLWVYDRGTYVVDEKYTPEYAYAPFVFRDEYDVGVTYRLRLKLNHEFSCSGVWLKTTPSWDTNSGQSASLVYEVKQVTPSDVEIYFNIIDNAVNAQNLILRINGLVSGSEYHILADMIKMFHYEFSGGQVEAPFIAFIGDSLTAQGYASYINSGDVAKQTYAVGGEGMSKIFKRTGIIPWCCENTTLNPGVNVLSHDGGNLFLQGMGNVNPVTIAGVTGTLSLDESQNLIFTAPEATVTKQIFNPEIIPNLSTLTPKTYVLWAGTNDMSSWTAEQIFEGWKQFINVHPNSLIVGLTLDTDETLRSKIATLNELAKNEFGIRFIDIHTWLLAHALAYNGLTATSDDTSAIAAGKLPPSIMTDTVHFNDYGKKAVAHLVEERLKNLGVL